MEGVFKTAYFMARGQIVRHVACGHSGCCNLRSSPSLIRSWLRFFRLCTFLVTNQVATFPPHEPKFHTTLLKETYTKDSQREYIHPHFVVANVSKEYDPIRPQLQLPSHGKGKHLCLFKNRLDLTISPCDCSRTLEASPQVSRAGKMEKIFEEDEVERE
ncbi:hypothetical protein LIER_29180 [Lithospermum erythrorhizon]|uniref:Uncharacterized protein n=1 Tax=Lithospermum erythrorhizon TaxID=34254 RepID=A0AAV3RJX7_LITER